MGKKKKSAARAAAAAGTAKKRTKKRLRNNDRWASPGPLPPGLVARIPAPVITSKHRTYLEFVENKDKKKKLEFEVTTVRAPPPGFEFVPVGNPDLTKACKELSRDQDAMIFIVSDSKEVDANRLGIHMNRVGHHVRRKIVEEARALIGQPSEDFQDAVDGPEPIPESQEEINAQADAVIRDLFPRMPNMDRQTIIDRSFCKAFPHRTVGLAPELTLSRRVQLAVLAHIRHTHTMYDQLLRDVGWSKARKAVEPVCLDFLVKWRGDEETGRDQLDEILREIIVISDSEDSDSEEDEDSDDSEDDGSDQRRPGSESPGSVLDEDPSSNDKSGPDVESIEPAGAGPLEEAVPHSVQPRKAVHRRLNSQNVQRYEAAAKSRWAEAQKRVRHSPLHESAPSMLAPAPQVAASFLVDQTTYGREGSRQLYDRYGRRSVPRDLHNQPNYRGSLEPAVRGSLPPVGPAEAVPFYRRSDRQLVPPSGNAMGAVGYKDPPDFGASRPLAERPELKDYLVPSIEPVSPQGDNSSSPVFVRALPPRSQQPQPMRQARPTGQVFRRRSASPLQRIPHYSAVPYIARERGPLPTRAVLTDVGRVSYGAGVQPYSRGNELRAERPRFRSPLYPEQPARDLHGAGMRENHALTYTRALPNRDSRHVTAATGPRPVPSEYQDRPIPRTERHPVVVEDWGRSAEVVLVPSNRAHPEHSPYLRQEGVMRTQGGSYVPVIALDDSSRPLLPHGRPVEEIRYPPSSREYLPAAVPIRAPSPLFYERVRPADPRQHQAADDGYMGRYGEGSTALHADNDARHTIGGPHNVGQSYTVISQSQIGHPVHRYPTDIGPPPRLQQPAASAPVRREYIELD